MWVTMPAAGSLPLIGSTIPPGLPWPAAVTMSALAMILVTLTRIHAQILEDRRNTRQTALATKALEKITTGDLADLPALLDPRSSSPSEPKPVPPQ